MKVFVKKIVSIIRRIMIKKKKGVSINKVFSNIEFFYKYEEVRIVSCIKFCIYNKYKLKSCKAHFDLSCQIKLEIKNKIKFKIKLEIKNK